MRAVPLAIAVLLAAASQAVAAAPLRPGSKVLPKPNAIVIMDNETIDSDRFAVPWLVQGSDGERLLVGDDRKGWVEQSQVVSLADAAAYYTQFINSKQRKSKPHKAWACYCRAAALQARGDLDAAIADYDEAIALDSSRAPPYVARGSAWESKKDYDKAITDYGQALRLDPAYPRVDEKLAWAHAERGRVCADKNNYDQAIADFSEAIRLEPAAVVAYANRGWAWTKKKEFEKAIADYNEAIRLDPLGCSALNNAAWLKATCPEQRFRNGREAVALATKACGLLQGEYFAWLDTLAAAHAEAGDFEHAIKAQNRAIELNPDDAEFVEGAKQRLALYQDHKPYRDE
ncbi:MAG TPA: tetratricopeptide repeat protein [Pirellulales bacterium]|jgi:tetratricopeptide (TPR) repeat protein|nr:tetratricopeptide repeat protein [Pirellulales bacterium]